MESKSLPVTRQTFKGYGFGPVALLGVAQATSENARAATTAACFKRRINVFGINMLRFGFSFIRRNAWDFRFFEWRPELESKAHSSAKAIVRMIHGRERHGFGKRVVRPDSLLPMLASIILAPHLDIQPRGKLQLLA